MCLKQLKLLGSDSAEALVRDLGKREVTDTIKLRLYKQKAVFRAFKTEIDTFTEQFEIRRESLNEQYEQLRGYFQRWKNALTRAIRPEKLAFLERRLESMIDEVEEDYPKHFDNLDSLR